MYFEYLGIEFKKYYFVYGLNSVFVFLFIDWFYDLYGVLEERFSYWVVGLSLLLIGYSVLVVYFWFFYFY